MCMFGLNAATRLLKVLAPAVLLLAASASFAQDALQQATQMIERRDAQGAYQLLKPLEQKRAGEPDFDLLLGIAANDTGRHQEAVFALERVLTVRPNDARARAEIGRAYIAMGETKTGKAEFAAVQAMGIPAEVRATINRYLEAVEQIPGPGEAQIRGYVEMIGGYDSNANAATSTNSFAVPAFGGLPLLLDPLSQKKSTWFASGGFGVGARIPFTPRWSFIGSINGNKRINQESANQFDTGSLDGSVGFQYARGPHVVSAVAQGQNYYVDNNSFRNAAGGTAQYQFNLSPRDQITAFVQYANLSYPDQGFRNVKRYVGGLGYGRGFDNGAAAFGSAYVGKEDEKDDAYPWIGNNFYGVRLGGQLPIINDQTTLFGSARYERRDYGGEDPFFMVDRRDKQYDVTVGVNYNFAKYWNVTPQYLYTKNSSNVPISAYDRNVLQISLRRSFY